MRSIRYTLPLLLLCGAASAEAQQGFMFKAPVAQLTLRAGPQVPRAQSDLFDHLTSQLTLERGDFRTPSIGVDLAVLLGDHLDAVFGVSWAEARARSEFREWEGADGEPIPQSTRLRTVPATLSIRFHPISRGRKVADYAWLPTRLTPYAGGGVGYTFYRLEQAGEFLNVGACEASPETGCDIFVQTYESQDGALTFHGLAGVEYWVQPRVGLRLEGRYTHGSAPLSQQFRSWERIDLTNFEAGVGLSFRW
jgi:opacity protein-like surface antigen